MTVITLFGALLVGVADAQEIGGSGRPTIEAQRWKEDWSPLADPAMRTRAFDRLKYVALDARDPQSYVSFGARLRERFERNDALFFGVEGASADSYLLHRLQVHADVHFDKRWRAFIQVEDVRAPFKAVIGGADENPLDLRLGFLDYRDTLAGGNLTLRIGRQDLDVGSERFISGREGPNVRQSFDALWSDWEAGPWHLAAFVTRPALHEWHALFDDRSNGDVRFGSIRVSRDIGLGTLGGYYGFYADAGPAIAEISGGERHVVDLRWFGDEAGWDWDLEGMIQSGRVGARDASAWGLGTDFGYTFEAEPLEPRVGLQINAASGNGNDGAGSVGTFNPLFPTGATFTRGDYTGYSNILLVKPTLSVTPSEALSMTAAVGLQWRQTTSDAIYAQPFVPLSDTAGRGDRWTGAYGQFRADYDFTPELTGALEVIHYDAGATIRDAGGKDSTYFGLQLTADW